MKHWFALFALLITIPGLTQAADDIAVHDAWIPAAPPGATVLAAYLTIDNHTATAQTLSGASSPQFESIEMHRTEIKNGVASMSAEPRIAIPAHGTLRFAPNGYHLMLIGPRRALHAGDHVELRVRFDGQPTQLIHAPVRAADAPADDMMQHHHHD